MAAMVLLCSCSSTPETASPLSPPTEKGESETVVSDSLLSWAEEDTAVVDTTGATVITLADSGSLVEGTGASATERGVTVTSGGVYLVRGTLSDGQLRVESSDDSTVFLIMDGARIHSETTAPLFVREAHKTVIHLAGGSENTLSDSASAVYEDVENEEPSGALFSKSDLTLNGSGTLTVNAAFKDGIVSRDGLKIADGSVTVSAADDALMGRDYVLIGGGRLHLTATGDGIKSTNDASAQVGIVRIEGGELHVESGADGIQAESTLSVVGGTVQVVSGGGSQNAPAQQGNDFGFRLETTETESVGKALKAKTILEMRGGTVTLDAADDAVHSNDAVTIDGGTLTVSAGDDGVHADRTLTIASGKLTIETSYEGLEAKTITLDGGDVRITASDDGINASSGSSEEEVNFGGFGGDPFETDDSALYIRGGTLHVDAMGDGIDSNGTIDMTGGTVTVVGPSNGGNGTLDCNGSFTVTGGTLVAIGSSGMAQTPSSDTMNAIVWGGCALTSGRTLSVCDRQGNEIVSLEATRAANWAYILSPELIAGEEYTLSDGYESRTITHSGGLHQIGTVGGMGGGFGGGRPDMGGNRPGMPPHGF